MEINILSLERMGLSFHGREYEKNKGGHVRSGEKLLQSFCGGCNSLTVHKIKWKS